MTIRKKTLMSVIVAVALLATATMLVGAQAPADIHAPAGTPGAVLPPLPEWPIIGPILRFLGLVQEAAPEVLPTPDPSLPEYRITALEDIDQLHDIEINERVRVIATDTDLNRVIQDLLSEAGYGEDAGLKVAFDGPMITADAYASARIIERSGVEVYATFTVEADNCSVTVTFEEVKANRWSFGLRPTANRLINEQIPKFWPEEICVESVIIMDGEAAVEGYRRE